MVGCGAEFLGLVETCFLIREGIHEGIIVGFKA
jgi:hypothetical protein